MAGPGNVQSDALPIPPSHSNRQQRQSETSRQISQKIKVGIFNADADTAISKRLFDRFNRHNCASEIFDFMVAGPPKMEILTEFITSHDMVLWIATPTSLKDEKMMKTARHISQFAAKFRRSVEFATFQPREYLRMQLPLELDAYSSLKEDEYFDERITKTLENVRKNMTRKKNLESDLHESTATASAIGGQNDELTRIAPVSDSISTGISSTIQERKEERLTAVRDDCGSSVDPIPEPPMQLPTRVTNLFVISDSKLKVNIDGRSTSATQENETRKKSQD